MVSPFNCCGIHSGSRYIPFPLSLLLYWYIVGSLGHFLETTHIVGIAESIGIVSE